MKFQNLRRTGGLVFALLLALVLTLALAGPGRAAAAEDAEYQLQITPRSPKLRVGQTLTLKAGWVGEKPSGTVVYEWTCSEDGDVVFISGDGMSTDTVATPDDTITVGALKPTGEGVTISVKVLGHETWTDERPLSIDAATAKVTLDEGTVISLKVGGEAELWAGCNNEPAFGEVTYTWTQSVDNGVISIKNQYNRENRGLAEVEALKQGMSDITVAAAWNPGKDLSGEGWSAASEALTVTVIQKLKIEELESKTLTVGSETTLNPVWDNGATKDLENAPGGVTGYTWSCSPADAVAFIDARTGEILRNGQATEGSVKIAALQEEANATITVAAVGDSDTDKLGRLEIKKPVLEITNPPAGEMQVGKTHPLGKELAGGPENGDGVTYEWTSSDESVISVDGESGEITAKGGGEAKIQVIAKWKPPGNTSQDPVELVRSAELVITVAAPNLSITPAPTGGSLQIGGEATLKATWANGTKPEGKIEYHWKYNGEDSISAITAENVTPEDNSEKKITANAVQARMTVNVTLEAEWGGGSATATYPLTIAAPELTIMDGQNEVSGVLPMTVGETKKLTVQITANTEPVGAVSSGPEYEWTVGPAEGENTTPVTIDKTSGAGPIEVTVSESGKAIVTVTATWTGKWGTETAVKVSQTLEISAEPPVLEIFNGNKNITQDPQKTLTLDVGQSAELTATLYNGPADGVQYDWTVSGATGNAVTLLNESKKNTATVTVNSKLEAEVTITVTARLDTGKRLADAKFYVATPAPVKSVKLDKTELTLSVDASETLKATVDPPNAGNYTVTWSSSNEKFAKVDDTGKVTGVAVGEAVITVTVKNGENTFTDTCKVKVVTPTVTGIAIGASDSIVRSRTDPVSWELTAALLPAGAELDGGEIVWTVTPVDGSDENGLTVEGQEGAPLKANVKSVAPGIYTVTAQYVKGGVKGASKSVTVTVSGITLTQRSVTLLVGQNTPVAIAKVYGFADTGSTVDVDWSSSDPAVVSVMYGDLTAWKLGKAVVTAAKNGYTAQCEVEVKEDEDVIVKGFTATTGNPLRLSRVYSSLNSIAFKKTQVTDESGKVIKEGSPLDYITNVTVSTSQGTLYYNYLSEANPGSTIASNDRFEMTAGGTTKSLDLLYFVPKQGFTGTAEITFIGWTGSTSFSGVIRVDVSGADAFISCRTQSGVPVYFLADEFDAFCRSRNGRSMNYVTFTLPQAGQGVLYYNYVVGEGLRVSASTRFSQTGRYTIGDVCFVPNDAFVGKVYISFRGVDTADQVFGGAVEVYVDPPGGDSSGTYLSGERGGPVVFQSSQLNDACRMAINDNLNFVTFKLPALEEGTLYYNYRGAGDFESRVTATTRYFYSGVPGINNVTFVPAANATGRIAISYTGYGVSGATFEGTLYVSLDDVDTNIYYFAAKNGSAAFDGASFNTVGLHRLGVNVDYVKFDLTDIDSSLGTLYYDYRNSGSIRVSSNSIYYLSPTGSQRRLSLITFRAGDTVGTVKIPYTAYSGTGANQKSFSGYVVIQVGSLTPADTGISCVNSGWAGLSGYELRLDCSSSMTGDLFYIEITSVPDPAMGHLYLNYYGFGTGTAVNPGDRFYYGGYPSINQLSFVPRAGFTGEAEITYIGHSSDTQEQVSGRVMVTVTGSRTSSFSDMGGYAWAIDSVEFLRRSGTVQGYGDGRFNPQGVITRGDFALMLVRAYGLTAAGGGSFYDVPAGSYYANAVRVAAALGIVQGYNGYFNPTAPLSRQDAMTMIFNIMKANGQIFNNGLAADFSVFRDEWQVAAYAREAMGCLIQMGIVKGDGSGYLLPLKQLDRAEAAVLMHNIMTL